MRQTREGCKCRCSIDRPNEVKMGLLTMTINELSKVVLHAAASNIHKSFHLDYHTAEDIASEAAAYALKGIQESGSLAVEKEWINKTIWKARNITKDRIKKLSNPDELLILDQSFVDENGKAFDDSPTLTKAAITKFATGNTTCELEKQENEQESRNLYKEERNREMQFVCNNYAQRSAGIFIARAFKHLSIADICKKFDTTPNAVSVIVSRIKEDVSIHKMIEVSASRTPIFASSATPLGGLGVSIFTRKSPTPHATRQIPRSSMAKLRGQSTSPGTLKSKRSPRTLPTISIFSCARRTSRG